jgi:hypothetical protein
MAGTAQTQLQFVQARSGLQDMDPMMIGYKVKGNNHLKKIAFLDPSCSVWIVVSSFAGH